MQIRTRTAAVTLAGLVLLGTGAPASARRHTSLPGAARPTPHDQETTAVTERASGTFEVNLTPQTNDDAEGTPLGRMSLDKRFHGDLDATSRGEMLTAVTPTQGSAGYVAVERVSGTLNGRAGTFVLLHRGVMTRGAQELSITVVPDSGTGELEGLAGTMEIRIEDGKHFYDFEYMLSAAP